MIFDKDSKIYKCKRISKKCFDQIKISRSFQRHPPYPDKIGCKTTIFLNYHKLDPIIINENYTLMDGYCAYLLAKEFKYRGLRLKIYMAKEIKEE